MTFQYFFFDTDFGYFLQALPIALLCGVIYVAWKRKREPQIGWGKLFLSCLFVCYFVGLLCLTLFLDIIGNGYYRLFYHLPSGRSVPWFRGVYDFKLTLWQGLNRENVGNFLMFLPYGIFYPLFHQKAGWKRTVVTGILTVGAIELLQPIVGRSFDSNDVVLNCVGVLLSSTVFFGIKTIYRKNLKKL